MSTQAIDVVMCTYNSVATIEGTLEALLDTARESDLRLIVSDNGSTDQTLDIVRDVVANRAGDLDVAILEHGANLGYATAVNRALERRRPASTVLVLNPDVVIPPPPDMFELIDELSGDTAVVSPLLVKGDGSLDHACARPEP
ncbi:MAG TPA: glycosyltransferase, partial [Dermatophilaceae bacterium]